MPPSAPLANTRILVIEDDPDVRSFFGTVLNESGAITHCVDCLSLATDCLKKEAQNFDLVISDYTVL